MFGGVLCRLVALTSLAYGTTNTLTVEVSTPAFVAPEGLLFCLATPRAELSNATVELKTLKGGGDQFEQDAEIILDGFSGGSVASVAFFQTKASFWDMDALEFGTVYDVLANDEYFSSSYSRRRYDDLQSKHNDFLVPSSATGEGEPNCVLVTGNWKEGTRYHLGFEVTNPVPGGGSAGTSPFSLWSAPVTYRNLDEDHIQYTIRGNKEGQMCSVGAILGSYGESPSLYDACDAVEATLSKKLSDPEACLADLKAHYSSDPLPGSDGYSSAVNVYKSENGLGISAAAVTNSTCGENEAFSPKFGGECISCGTGEIEYSAATSQPLSCSCPAHNERHRIGSPACGPAKSVIRASNTTRQVAESLCSFYGQKYDELLEEKASALSVTHSYVQDFLDQAHAFLDRDDLYRINETFWREFMFDERVKDSPTRRFGIKPNCYKCDEGKFVDFDSGEKVMARDDFFEAVHTLRLLGLALYTKGYSCDKLFLAADPFKGAYGAFSTDVCQTF
ncbi:hypothetical protein HOP50_06g45570 [Chloropicon primus]|uniref:Uncharacterized protein n=1 Tax=Chloropicon primus TaxID=1764295 RepID=A0A5B8MN70_9CHLO|nr:hypothetical protein A3770_06p45340 [Chloropicon primus]UPR01236.1 hypothetical protein HOP50_06g45570 [Chloropicon primus]|eukprot:QDZ22016.1 hypothetical protein A3770_06p45340 [Chloropicon primus]